MQKENAQQRVKQQQRIVSNDFEEEKILCFNCFYEEELAINPKEKKCRRKLILSYFLEDSTVKIYEPLVQNFGFDQGLFFSRQPVIVDKQLLSPMQIKVGEFLNIYKKQLFVYDCDIQTRNWY